MDTPPSASQEVGKGRSMGSWGKPWQREAAGGARGNAFHHVALFSSARGWDCELCESKMNWWTREVCRECGGLQKDYAAQMLHPQAPPVVRNTRRDWADVVRGGGKGKGFGVKGKGVPEEGRAKGERNVGEKGGGGGAKGENVAGLTQQQAIMLLSAFVECLTDAPDPTRVEQLREETLKALGGRVVRSGPAKLDLETQYAKTKKGRDGLKRRRDKLKQEIVQRKEQLQKMEDAYEDVRSKLEENLQRSGN